MSFIKDVLSFEKFALGDMWKKIRKDPERLLLGGITPWDTKVTNKLTGKDYEPLVDQMGGQYGGSTLTLGDTGEGVYGRAAVAGVPTKAGAGMHDIAHLITSLFAGGYGADKLGALGGGGGGGGILDSSGTVIPGTEGVGATGGGPAWLQKLNTGFGKIGNFGGMGMGGGGQQQPDPAQQQQVMQMMAALLQKQRTNPFLPTNTPIRAGNYRAGNYYG
jgi:hypothetical protein